MTEGIIPNHKKIMALGGPKVAVYDNQPSSHAPNNDESTWSIFYNILSTWQQKILKRWEIEHGQWNLHIIRINKQKEM